MAKADNRKQIATAEQRAAANNIRASRQHIGEWRDVENANKATLLDSLDGERDVTLTTEQGIEVLSVTESEPTQAVDWKAFRKDHPELEDEIQKYLKPATTTTTIRTSWVEQDLQTAE